MFKTSNPTNNFFRPLDPWNPQCIFIHYPNSYIIFIGLAYGQLHILPPLYGLRMIEIIEQFIRVDSLYINPRFHPLYLILTEMVACTQVYLYLIANQFIESILLFILLAGGRQNNYCSLALNLWLLLIFLDYLFLFYYFHWLPQQIDGLSLGLNWFLRDVLNFLLLGLVLQPLRRFDD